MALKAGRRGLNKRLVDAFGNLNGEAPSGEYYTKTQTDNKFETKTHVNNTFQKKTLEVPLEMLSGSKLTVEDALQGLNEEKFTYADNSVLGAKNLIPYPYFSKNTTVAGITWTVDSDGIITANGTSQDSSFSLVSSTKKLLLKKGSYLLTGGHTDTKVVFLYDGTSFHTDYGEGRLITFDNDIEVEIAIRIRDGQTASNEVFKPMLRLASDPDDTYVPYAMTNREITEELTVQESAVTDTPSGATVNVGIVKKYGKIVQLDLSLTGITASVDDVIAKVPTGFLPVTMVRDITAGGKPYRINTNGNIQTVSDISTTDYTSIHVTWLTN